MMLLFGVWEEGLVGIGGCGCGCDEEEGKGSLVECGEVLME